jgi:hypothetical protein
MAKCPTGHFDVMIPLVGIDLGEKFPFIRITRIEKALAAA